MASFVENKRMIEKSDSNLVKNDYFTRLELDDEDGNEFSDRWNTGELLCLASAVQRSGDKNWVSVSRSIKPFGDPKRPADWYTPKNCALQYSKLLKGVEDFKKKSLPRTERETSEELLVKNLTDKRITELNWLNQQTKTLANSLKIHLEALECGEYDDQLDDLLKQIEEQEKKDEEDFREWIARRETLNVAKKLNKCRVPLSKGKAPSRGLDSKRKNSPNPDQVEDVSAHSTLADVTIKTEVESDHEFPISTKPIHIKQEVIDTPSSISALLEGSKASTIVPPSPVPTTPTSPLLTSLLRSVSSNNTGAPVVSYVSSPLKEVKVESSSQSGNGSMDNTRKTEVFLSPTKTVMTGISPLLTSLLKSPTSAAPTSTSMASKESDASDVKGADIDMVALIAKAQEVSPRASVSQSPRPTPASSPLLNSLLKSSPGSVSPLTSIQLSQNKEANTPKAVSSPQPFFNPTSALATAAAQQLAVATSSLPQSHVFFPQDSSESHKRPLQSSPATSACLSAPTLSKLLEMPPSTPGRLPPLPVVEPVSITPSTTPVSSIPEQPVSQSPKKLSSGTILLNELELQSTSSPSKKSENTLSTEVLTMSDQSVLKKVPVPVSSVSKKPIVTLSNTTAKTAAADPKTPSKRQSEIDDTSQENIDILEAVCVSINQAFEEKEIKQETAQSNTPGKSKKEPSTDNLNTKLGIKVEKIIPDDVLNAAINIEKLISSDMSLDEKIFSEDITDSSDLNLFDDDKQKSDIEIDTPLTQTSEGATDATDDDKANGRKFYKSRTTSKKRPSVDEDTEKPSEVSPTSKTTTKKTCKPVKMESDSVPQVPVNEQLLLAAKEAEEATMHKIPEKSPSKASDVKMPPAKKPRLYEKTTTKEKKELSEDEIPLAKRPGRKAKKGRKPKSTPVKQDEPKDQYEFSESTEENSVGYQTTNTLCYMPRLKDDVRFEESKIKQLQTSEENSAATSTMSGTDKKHGGIPVKNKPGKSATQSSVRKGLFTSDEDRMSDSMTSDDASNSHFGDDKLKKWKEYNEKKEDSLKDMDDSAKVSQKVSKNTDAPKKKMQQTKRNLFSKSDAPKKVEKKSVGSDVEESSVCSRDSEDAASSTTWQREEGETNEIKDTSPAVGDDVEEINDSRMSSSVTAESDKQMDEVEGYESLQGSVTTEFSPQAQSEIKEEKELSQFGKQDWYHGASPKSSEPVSQSSEESEYESDNWDNQSVSTNKSATHSTGPSSKSKRKERESPQYKAWKKAISIVLREASCHKYANVFLQKVTNDVAPGYLNIVYRPMDLSLIKKNVDNGVVKTTDEVHRDMLLMFQNAVMYNSSDHDVHHMAVEMQRDVIQQIQAFLTTQFNDKDESNEPTSSLRGARSAKSQKVYGSASKLKEESHEKE